VAPQVRSSTTAGWSTFPRRPVGDTELKPLNLSVTELAHLEAFLRGLSRAPQDAAGVAV